MCEKLKQAKKRNEKLNATVTSATIPADNSLSLFNSGQTHRHTHRQTDTDADTLSLFLSLYLSLSLSLSLSFFLSHGDQEN